jgi:hypothetical protein
MSGPPQADEVEVTLLGPGRGESVIVHLGAGEWLIVDSCATKSGGAAPLRYLAHLGVAPDAVRWLVASHWHDDHVRGFGELVESCPNAKVAQAAALEQDEFLSLVVAAEGVMVDGPSGVDEMRRTVMALSADGRGRPEFVRADQRLDMVAASPAGPGFEFWALSPSNEALVDALKEFATYAAVSGETKRTVPRPKRNPSSVVLYVRVGATLVLLGADLESESSDGRGWRAIVQSSGRPTEPAHYVKIPHHGSVDAHDETMWTELVVDSPHGGVTPFRAGKTSLPRNSDIDRIAKRSPNIWLTRSGATASSPRRPSAVERTLRSAVRSIEVISVDPGRVTMRCPAGRPGEWTIDAPQPARRLQPSS